MVALMGLRDPSNLTLNRACRTTVGPPRAGHEAPRSIGGHARVGRSLRAVRSPPASRRPSRSKCTRRVRRVTEAGLRGREGSFEHGLVPPLMRNPGRSRHGLRQGLQVLGSKPCPADDLVECLDLLPDFRVTSEDHESLIQSREEVTLLGLGDPPSGSNGIPSPGGARRASVRDDCGSGCTGDSSRHQGPRQRERPAPALLPTTTRLC